MTSLSGIATALSTAFTVSEIVTLIGQVVGAGAAFVLAWFGARKLVYGVQRAFKGGKLKI